MKFDIFFAPFPRATQLTTIATKQKSTYKFYLVSASFFKLPKLGSNQRPSD